MMSDLYHAKYAQKEYERKVAAHLLDQARYKAIKEHNVMTAQAITHSAGITKILTMSKFVNQRMAEIRAKWRCWVRTVKEPNTICCDQPCIDCSKG